MSFFWSQPTGPTVVDDFESQGNWTWDVVTATNETPSSVISGSQMLKSPTGNFNGDDVQEPNGENFVYGEKSRVYFYIDDGCTLRFLWGKDISTGDGYRCELATGSGTLDLERVDGGTPTDLNTTTINSVGAGHWNYVDITWDDGSINGTTGEHTVEFFDATDDTSYGSLSAVDTTYTDSATYNGCGFYTSGLDGNGFFDYWHKGVGDLE